MPTFERHSGRGVERTAFEPAALIMAGWTGRDRAAVDHHITELAALGVPGPSRIPTFYRLDPALLAGPVRAAPIRLPAARPSPRRDRDGAGPCCV